jgi:O-antigen ligase
LLRRWESNLKSKPRNNKEIWTTAFIVFGGCGATLAINPWFGYDPINLPKFLVLGIASGALLPFVLGTILQGRMFKKFYVVVSLLFCAWLTLSITQSDTPFNQQLFGVWGRSTGLLTYLFFVILFLASSFFLNRTFEPIVVKSLERTSYFVTAYTTVQYLGSDPLNWSQKQMFGTLGNINFMSAFLGFVSVMFAQRLFSKSGTITSRIHYLFFLSLNLFLIGKSGSIQGIGIFLIGSASLSLLWLYAQRDILQVVLATVILSAAGVLTVLGIAGRGPLRAIQQETLFFRTDYWRAGVEMIQSNKLFGLGIDAYGDYYRFYRDELAVSRTSPGRISNTAHNVFLDIGSGSGILALSLFLALILIVLAKGFRFLLRNGWEENIAGYLSMLIALQFFFLISINQIGVAVWVFIIMGLVVNITERVGDPLDATSPLKKSNTPRDQRDKGSRLSDQSSKLERGDLSLRIASVISLLGLGLLASQPVTADSRFLNLYKNRQAQDIEKIFDQFGLTTFHKEKAIELLIEQQRPQEAVVLAEKVVIQNPRSFFAWTVIAFSGGASSERVEVARAKLRTLDPLNPELLRR